MARIWRYPVKSCGGELLDDVEVDARGLAFDRWWAVHTPDGKFGAGKNTRRFRRMEELLNLQARLTDPAAPILTFPDGTTMSGDDPQIDATLSAYVRQPVRLRAEGEITHMEESPVHLVFTAYLDDLAARSHRPHVDERRFRPSFVVDTGTTVMPHEEQLVGALLGIGDVVLAVTHLTERCVDTNHRQGRDVPEDHDMLRDIGRHRDLAFGVYADVHASGRVQVGDTCRASSWAHVG